MTQIINLTPHDLNIVDRRGHTIVIEKSGEIARCSQKEVVVGTLVDEGQINETTIASLSFDLTMIEMGEVTGLPAPEEGKIFVVSRVVAEAVKGTRDDVIIPGPAIRDDQGRIIGARGFSKI